MVEVAAWPRLAAGRLAVATTVMCFGACAHLGTREHVSAPPESVPSRCLFEVRYQQADRDGRFKLVLWEDAEGFRLAASDSLGRGLWLYDQVGQTGLWIDRRGKSHCRIEGNAALAVEDFGEVRVMAIPALLQGRYDQLPADLFPTVDDEGAHLVVRDAVVTWQRHHCEPASPQRPSLERFLDWPENCAPGAGRGE